MSTNSLVTREMPELSMEIIKKFICPSATDQEAYTFLQLCKAQSLNPFLREAYLIKYGTAAASIVVGKETFMKRADRLAQYNGFKAGLILLSDNKIIWREGSFLTSSETLLGGWAEVYRQDRQTPYRNEVRLEEYQGRTSGGEITKMWREKPATMIRKVALMQSLREAFPDEFGGLYGAEEISTVDALALPTYEIGQHPAIPPPREPIAMPKEIPAAEEKKAEAATGTQAAKPTSPIISEAQSKRLYAIAKGAGYTDDGIKTVLKQYGYEHSKDVCKSDYEAICNELSQPPSEERSPSEEG